MMTTTNGSKDRPMASYIQIAEDGTPWLQGYRCEACGEVLQALHRACPNCAAVGRMAPVRLSDRGALYSYTIVHRSFPGVKTPLISAVVRMDDGVFIKGNLEGVEPTPQAIAFDMPVRLEFETMDARDDQGGRLVRPVFRPVPQV
jgi:uncharacterized OB-fold protein